MDIKKIEKRISGRKKIDLIRTEICYNGKQHAGVIEDICKYGLHLTTVSKESVTYFLPEEVFELEIYMSDKNNVNIKCETRWVHVNKTPTHGFAYRMGMRIIGHNEDFKKFLQPQAASRT